MQKLLSVYKPQGLTPLEVVNLVKEKFPEYKNAKIGYAGRLDPLAHGVLLLMIGDATKEKDKYLNLPKEYEFEAVFGVSTDTYDVLGMLVSSRATEGSRGISYHKAALKRSLRSSADSVGMTKEIQSFIKSKLGKQIQIYPTFSSKTVQGKPLFWWARNNKLSEIQIPQREIEIYDFKLLEIKEISAAKLKKEIFRQIALVTGDFRQEQIKNTWNTLFTKDQRPASPAGRLKTNSRFLTAKLKISCSSGTYVRSIVNELGNRLNSGAITIDILRTKVGKYVLENSIKLT
jgi:tRNA pseudouridine55 synthase